MCSFATSAVATRHFFCEKDDISFPVQKCILHFPCTLSLSACERVCSNGFRKGFLRMHLIVSNERFMRAA